MVCLLSNPTRNDIIKRNKKSINLSKGKKCSTHVSVFNYGYNSGLGGKGYAFEGQTLPQGNGVDLNFTKGIPKKFNLGGPQGPPVIFSDNKVHTINIIIHFQIKLKNFLGVDHKK
jgi:hypothetical protein